MTPANFHRITNNAIVRIVHTHGGGLFVQGVTQDELAELVTLAGRQLGAMPDDKAVINPEYLAATLGGFMHHPDVVCIGPSPSGCEA